MDLCGRRGYWPTTVFGSSEKSSFQVGPFKPTNFREGTGRGLTETRDAKTVWRKVGESEVAFTVLGRAQYKLPASIPPMQTMKQHLTILLLVITCVTSSTSHAETPSYSEHVQPIFAEHCYECHGPETQESNYRLDVRSRALGSGDLGQPIVVGESKKSPLIRYVSREDDETAMPPEGEGTALSPEQVRILREWIDAGAEWPDDLAGEENDKLTTDHWSLSLIHI